MELKPIYSVRKIEGRTFQLAERVDNYRDKILAKAEYACEGLYVRTERVPQLGCYYIWTRKGRKETPALLEGEKIRRVKPRRTTSNIKLVS